MFSIFLLAAFRASAGVAAPTNNLQHDDSQSYSLTLSGRGLLEFINPTVQRTSTEIAQSCILTIIACTWVALHPNVPHPRTSFGQRLWTRVKMMAQTFIGPEFLFIFALRQWIAARKHRDEYNQRFGLTPSPTIWSRFRNWLCNRTPPDLILETSPQKNLFSEDEALTEEDKGLMVACTPMDCKTLVESPQLHIPWTIMHGFLLEMGGLVVDENEEPLRVITRVDQLAKGFDIPESHIMDKGQTDFFAKLIAIGQTIWFIVLCTAPLESHLSVTQLEVVALALAFLKGVTYWCWLDKPQNMMVPFSLPDPSYVDDAKVTRVYSDVSPRKFNLKKAILVPVVPFARAMGYPIAMPDHKLKPYITRWYSSTPPLTDNVWASFLLAVVGTIFGAIHLIPLKLSSFPTDPTRLLWMVAAVVITTEPAFLLMGLPAFMATASPGQVRGWSLKRILHYVLALLIGANALACVISRYLILVIAIATLPGVPIKWHGILPEI